MRDDGRSRPDVLAYLDAENEYASQHLARLDALADDLADEMSAPLPDVEWRPPRAVGDYEYAERRGEGDDYWDVLRRPRAAVAGADERSGGGGGEEGGEDEATAAAAAGGPGGGGGWRAAAPFNRLARGHAYFDVARWAPAPGGAWLAFAVDTRGDEEYSLYVLPLGGSSGDEEKEGEGDDDGSEGGDAAKAGSGGAGSHGPSAWEGPGAPVLVARGAAAGGQVAWSADSRALLYLEQPGSNERQGGSATRVLRRRVAAAPGNSAAAAASPGDAAGDAAGDAVLLELDAGALDLELSVSSSGSFLMLKYGAGVSQHARGWGQVYHVCGLGVTNGGRVGRWHKGHGAAPPLLAIAPTPGPRTSPLSTPSPGRRRRAGARHARGLHGPWHPKAAAAARRAEQQQRRRQ